MNARACLVLYASTHGHTGRIAVRIGEELRTQQLDVRIVDVKKSAGLDPTQFDLVVIGASVHAGHHQTEMIDWLRRHAVGLAATPVALFSVSLTAADDSEEARAATREYVDELLEETNLCPQRVQTFAGALQYREYNLATRVLVRLVARHKGLSTDSAIDSDYTDWDAVGAFAHEAAGLLTPAAAR